MRSECKSASAVQRIAGARVAAEEGEGEEAAATPGCVANGNWYLAIAAGCLLPLRMWQKAKGNWQLLPAAYYCTAASRGRGVRGGRGVR